MGQRIKPKQMDDSSVSIMGVTAFSAVGSSDIVTTALSSLASADGVPVIASAGIKSSNGFIVTGLNRIEIANSINKKAIEIDSNEVFGRLTEAAGVYTLSYFTLQSGVETSVAISAQDINFVVGYNYLRKDKPFDSVLRATNIVIGEDPANTGGRPIKNEVVTITGTNAMADLSKTPIAATLFIGVNSVTEDEATGGALSVVGKTVSWSAVNAKYNLETTDRAIASYFTLES